MTDLIIFIMAAIIIFIGVLCFLMFIFPSHFFILAVAIIFGFIDHFQHLKLWELGILSVLTAIMVFVDYFSGLLGAKFSGASKKSIAWGIVGLILGLILWPPFGSLTGLFMGIFGAEFYYFKETKRAIKSASGSVIGVIAGTMTNIILGLFFLGLFILFGLN